MFEKRALILLPLPMFGEVSMASERAQVSAVKAKRFQALARARLPASHLLMHVHAAQ
jgi:hypothetical protein